MPIAPFHVHLLPLSPSEAVTKKAEELYHRLTEAGIEVLWDDRDERAGVKFNDADLIGVPFQLLIGDKNLAQGLVEWKARKTGQVQKLTPEQVLALASNLNAQ